MRRLLPMLRNGSMVLFLVITGCASVPPTTKTLVSPAVAWQARQNELGKIHSWSLNGRIAVKTADDSWSSTIYWQQWNDAFDIRFMNYLGQVIAQLNGRPGKVTLQTSDKNVTATDMNGLLRDHPGWNIPVQGLRYWVLGMPDPEVVGRRELDKQGRLTRLEQYGWHIEFTKYWHTHEIEIPKKIILEHPELHVRLIIDRWEEVTDMQQGRVQRKLMYKMKLENA